MLTSKQRAYLRGLGTSCPAIMQVGKGGIVISIKQELGIPVKFIGVGEKIDDMQEFDATQFIDALFE